MVGIVVVVYVNDGKDAEPALDIDADDTSVNPGTVALMIDAELPSFLINSSPIRSMVDLCEYDWCCGERWWYVVV